jgi:hypothetical protein
LQGFDGSCFCPSEEVLELREDLLDEVEIGAVRRRKHQSRSDRFYRCSDSLALMTAGIIHNNKVAALERRQQELVDIALEAWAIDGATKHARSRDAIDMQGGKEGRSLPVAIGNKVLQAHTFFTSAAKLCHVGLGLGFVNEDETRSINTIMLLAQPISASPDVRS